MLSKEWYKGFYRKERDDWEVIYKKDKLNEEDEDCFYTSYGEGEDGEIYIAYSINHYYTWHTLEKIKKHYPGKDIKFIDDDIVAISVHDKGEQLNLFEVTI